MTTTNTFTAKAVQLVADNGTFWWAGMIVHHTPHGVDEWDECALDEHWHTKESAALRCAQRAARQYTRDCRD